MKARILIADDEPLLREALATQLATAWPEAQVVAAARNGREALELFARHAPNVCFLDVQMPGISGIEVARQIGNRAHLVFVTAYDHYAVDAFAAGVLDYLVKPVTRERLFATVERLAERMRNAQAAIANDELLERLAERLQRPASNHLRWIRSAIGATTRLISVDDIEYLRSDEKYTLIAWRGDEGKPGEALIRMPLKELVAQLDPELFAQVHRSVVVNLRAISHVKRGLNETADIHLKGRSEVLPVSRNYLHLFRQM